MAQQRGRIAVVADVHLGNHRRHGGEVHAGLNARCRASLRVLAAAVDAAVRRGAATFVVAGDLFDSTRPPPQLLAEVQRIFSAAGHAGMAVLLLVGNHDQAGEATGDHALGPLAPVADIIERPRVTDDLVLVPFLARPGAELLAAVDFRGLGRHLLVVHMGVRDEATPPWLRDAEDSADVDVIAAEAVRLGCAGAAAGNWHAGQLWAPPRVPVPVLQVGALVPTGWDNPGLHGYGTLATWDRDTAMWTRDELPGPRFVRLPFGEVSKTGWAGALPKGVFVQVVCGTTEELRVAAEVLDRAVSTGTAVVGGEAVLDDAVMQAAAREAVRAVGTAQTMDEALAGYVGKMPLADGVDRSRVLARARALMETAR